MKICLVWPASSVSYYSPGLHRRWSWGRALLPNLALPTLAALTPDGVDLELFDADFDPIPYHTDAPFVAISGYYTNWPRMREMAREFRRRGKVVLMGGPFASLTPETVRPEVDILVRGEAEEIWPEIVEDLAAGSWRSEYEAPGLVDLRRSPVPRWELLPLQRYAQGLVQTARGCPYQCDFCDVVAFVGRKVRTKEPDQVLAELEALHRLGMRFAMLADDNLTVHRAHARRVLDAIRRWQATLSEPMLLSTQVSIEISEHPELLRLAAEAGLAFAYIGIETSNTAALEAAGKTPNTRTDTLAALRKVQEAGIVVLGGVISGFDQDDAGTFRRNFDLLQASGVPIVFPSLLTASPRTPLWERLRAEGRLVAQGGKEAASDQVLHTNIVPLRMSREELEAGHRWLVARAFEPSAYRKRFTDLMRRLPRHRPQPRMPFLRIAAGAARRTPLAVRLRALAATLRLALFYARPSNWPLAISLLGWLLRRPRYADVVNAHATMYPQSREILARIQRLAEES